VRDNVNIKLTDATAAELARRPIEYDTGFTLLPGKYRIKFLARDDETGRIGTYQTTFVIPNLNKEVQRIAISSVVLSSQRVEPNEALFDAAKGKDKEKEAAVNPLVQDGKKLVPSVTRVFSTSRPMYVYLQVYNAAVANTGAPTANTLAQDKTPLSTIFGFVSLYRDGSKVFETPATASMPSPASRLGTAPLSFSFDLPQLPPGEYECQVTVLNPANSKSVFWRAPIMLVP
jgi:hypothetical protein